HRIALFFRHVNFIPSPGAGTPAGLRRPAALSVKNAGQPQQREGMKGPTHGPMRKDYAVPPTVSVSSFSVGWPTPTG
ncbi:hypothetical protein BLA29_015468, partial [Euroglyphus maynei]